MPDFTRIRNDEKVAVRIEDLANTDITDNRRVAGQEARGAAPAVTVRGHSPTVRCTIAPLAG